MSTPAQAPSGRLIPLLLGTGGLLVLGGVALFWLASAQNKPETAGAIPVTVTATACEPMALEVPAGPASFLIRNASDRPVEWEILNGVMVVAERENIAPGFSSVLSERLKPGVYDITCGLLSNPRGKLTVLATAESAAETAAPPLRELIGPLSERKVQLMKAAGKFARAAQALQQAIDAGDLAAAKTAWTQAAADWASLGTVAPQAADLQNRIAPQAAWLAKREADPRFTGLHRLEYGLFAQSSLDGLAPVAAALSKDAVEFQARVKAFDGTPEGIAADAARYARSLADATAANSLTPYAGDDHLLLAAGLETLERARAVLDPLLSAADPAQAAKVTVSIETVHAAVTAVPLDHKATAAALTAAADALAGINATLGLEP
ncbi:iron uptake system component EfeO [Rhodobacter viridis]|uniref:Iron uptake system component EfeO n=1 Tax=Rhodobacter viridis TaxID=1054202 RepID=A0A318U0U9_9RHOB|nr:cupredoxin domain-containing protein [Rhodobacter viridis]PYF09642.1 iron uptake system component EfeO [Rhodobacter viridis]